MTTAPGSAPLPGSPGSASPPAPAPIVITGTGTDVGKTVATAALAAHGLSEGLDVGICKPIQTGLSPGEPGDAHEAARLSGVRRVLEVRRLPDPLAPETAARVAGLPQSTLPELIDPIRAWLRAGGSASDSAATPGPARGRLDLVEGAGGVLVRLGTDLTVLDLARSLDAPVIVVARAGLGTLSDTELTVRAIEAAGLRCAGIVIGSWPADPDLAERCNLEDLPRVTGVPVLGRVPAGAGALEPDEFGRRAPGWFESGPVTALRRDAPGAQVTPAAGT
ncbi:dethiobiotin synthetase [Dietzia kunjamensis subsp. schimae]|uniref:ATP-dependent dethiobiotin synthetase BioD n=1 Tax=Dietzia kunjamensis subsp. schimae TaxID=498198 RepID=A0ABY1MZ67_9ACTN|nr:dethiobiotin synthase [Dietzia kunjamensis]SMO55677.1 dethiobiotin synthetase [Dietzia kunjamensis subsp. schimae]